MPTKKPNKAGEIIGKIFRDNETLYGLKEFEGFDFERVLDITEDEPDRFYVADLKSRKKRLASNSGGGVVIRGFASFTIPAPFRRSPPTRRSSPST